MTRNGRRALHGAPQIAEYLGWSPYLTRKAIRDGQLPVARIGSSLIAYKDDLDAAVDRLIEAGATADPAPAEDPPEPRRYHRSRRRELV